MKKILLIMLSVIGVTACGNNQSANSKNETKSAQKEYVEVLYFHGKQRCITCNAIENLTKEVLNQDFSELLKNEKIIFKVIDISTKEGEEIADKYEVTWSSLYINKWKDGVEAKNNMTDFGFGYAKNSSDVFKDGIKKKIEELIK